MAPQFQGLQCIVHWFHYFWTVLRQSTRSRKHTLEQSWFPPKDRKGPGFTVLSKVTYLPMTSLPSSRTQLSRLPLLPDDVTGWQRSPEHLCLGVHLSFKCCHTNTAVSATLSRLLSYLSVYCQGTEPKSRNSTVFSEVAVLTSEAE